MGATITTTTTTTIETAAEHTTTIATEVPQETEPMHGKCFPTKTNWRTATTSNADRAKFGDQKERITAATAGLTDIACTRSRTPDHYATTKPTDIKTILLVRTPWEEVRTGKISIDGQGTTTN